MHESPPPQSAAVESPLLSGRWAGQEAQANDQGRERADRRAQGALSSGTLVNPTLLRCPATAASAELAAARPQAAISVLVKASRTGRSASHPAPRGAAQRQWFHELRLMRPHDDPPGLPRASRAGLYTAQNPCRVGCALRRSTGTTSNRTLLGSFTRVRILSLATLKIHS